MISTVFRDELEVAMKLLGITDIAQAHPGLTNTLDIDHLVPDTVEHPWIRWRSKARL
jgi:L-lactate dehydrogenase (cytochrome)